MRLTTSPPSCAEYHEIWVLKPPGTLWAIPGLLWDSFTFYVAAFLPLVCQCQQALNDISARHAVRLYWVPGHAGVRGNEIADELARSGSGQRFIGPQPCFGVSRQNIRKKMKRWMRNQHLALWRGPCSAQRQARELISGHRGPTTVL